MKRSLGDVKKAAGQTAVTSRLEKDLNIKLVLGGLAVTFVLMIFVYKVFAGAYPPALLAAAVMVVAGFFFAAVSGNLVGTIGSSNNPISGLTLSTLIIAALLMVLIGAKGIQRCRRGARRRRRGLRLLGRRRRNAPGPESRAYPRAALRGRCRSETSSAFSSLPLSSIFRLLILIGAFKLGSRDLPAPQAGLMAALAQGIVGGEMAWPLVIFGMLMGFAFILVQVRSPMLVAVGMYLPLETTFAIFCGGMIKGIVDKFIAKRKLNPAQKARVENVGILLAAGLIAGESLTALVRAAWKFFFLQKVIHFDVPEIFVGPNYFAHLDRYIGGLAVLALIAFYLIAVPLRKAGAPDEPPPPSAVI